MPPQVRRSIEIAASRYPAGERDDLLQEAEIAYWQAAQRFDPARGCKLSTYAMVRIRGALLDWLRQVDYRQRGSEIEPILLPGDIHAAGNDSPERSALLHLALNKLTAAERREILLYYCHGYKLREIGTMTGTTEAAACMRMKRTTTKLRRVLCGLQ